MSRTTPVVTTGSGTAVAGARLGLLQISAAGVLWGTGGLAVTLLRERTPMSVLTISAHRLAIATVVLVGVLALTRQLAALVRLLREHPGAVVLVGGCTAAYQALYFAAVVAVGVTVATVVSLALAPLLLTAVDAARGRRAPGAAARPHPAVLTAALLGLVLVSVSAGATDVGPHPTWGVLAALASGAAYALTTAVGQRLSRQAGPVAVTTATTTVGAALLLPLGVAGAAAAGPLLPTDVATTAILLYLGVLTMALPYGLLYAGLRSTASSAAVVATLLEPVAAALLAAVVLGERVGPWGVTGSLLILAAVVGVHRRPSADAVPPG